MEFLFARKRDNRMRVRHIHIYSAQGLLNARDRHVNVGRSTGSSWTHVNAVQDLGLAPLIDNADSANSPSGAHLNFLIGHQAFAAQMINKDADTVAAHFRDRPVGIAVVHEPATILHDGTHQSISADTERRRAETTHLYSIDIVCVIGICVDNEGIPGAVGFRNTS